MTPMEFQGHNLSFTRITLRTVSNFPSKASEGTGALASEAKHTRRKHRNRGLKRARRHHVWRRRVSFSLTSTHLCVGIAAGRAGLLLDVERSLSASSADDVRLGVALSETSGTLGHGCVFR